MANVKQSIRRSVSVLLSALMCTSALSVMASVSAAAVSYSEMSALDSQAYSGNDLGAVYSKSSTTFKVWAPTASKVQLKRYKTGSDSESGAGVIETKDMTKQSQGIWSITISGDIANTYYTYLVTNNGTVKETVDIYAKSTGVNGKRGMVVDLDSTDPVGWENDTRVKCPNQTDAVIWEAHVRDFSVSSDSGMQNKGKYLAFTETGTTVNNDGIHPTGVDYLEDLGVTHVHLLPVYDYASVDETKLNTDQFNWGYDPMNYNTPEGSYSTDPYHGEVRVNEFKQMVQSLHKKGIGVVMDVVYNHTYAGGSGVNDWFDYTVPGYYYRQDASGKYSNASGCGNETASDRAMYQKFMVDSLKYWAEEYHLDGFRFDLMGIHDVDTMNVIRQELDKISPELLIYGEPWTAAATPCPKDTAVQGNMSYVSEEVAAFNDKVRDAIKGSCFNAASPGFIQGASNLETALKAGIQANSSTAWDNKWSKQPSQTVTYTSAHDNYTLYDKLVRSVKGEVGYGNRYDDLVAMNKLAGGIILTSQGMSFFQAGEEFARSKGGDENSYQSATSVNQLTWSNTITYADIVSYYKGLIAIRKAYDPFRDPTNTSNNTIYFSWGDSCPANVVAFTMYNKQSTGKEWNFAAVIHNANTSSKTVRLMTYDGVTLPTQWVKVADGTNAGTESLGTVSGNTVTVPARSTVVLIDKTSFDNTDLNSTKCKVTVNHIMEATGEILATETLKGEEGTSYTASPSSALLNQNLMVDHTTGAKTGTFSKAGATVNFYYKEDTTNIGSVWIKYIDSESGAKIAEDEFIRGTIGTAVNLTPKKLSGYEYETMIQSADCSVFSQYTPLVTMYYKPKTTNGALVHYYNSQNWSNVYMYSYTEVSGKATEYTGGWPGTVMTNDGDGWYSGVVTGASSAKFIANNNGNPQDPAGTGSSGYDVTGEVWIKNGKVYPTGIVNVYLESESSGKRDLLQTIKGMADGINTYEATPDLPVGGKIVTPDNTSGLIKEGVTEVVYISKPYTVDLLNCSELSADTINLGQSVTIKGQSESSGLDVFYTYQYKKSTASSFTTIGNAKTSETSVKFTPSQAGEYTIRVIAENELGLSESLDLTLTVQQSTGELKNTSSISTKNVEAGFPVTITGSATGGAGSYKYAFYFKKSTETEYTYLGVPYGNATSATFYPAVGGTYQVMVRVKDAKGKISKTSFTVKSDKSTSTLANKSTLKASEITLGSAFRVTAKATGGTGSYSYAFYFKRSSNKEWKLLGTEFGTASTAKVTPTSAASYDFRVLIKDGTGRVVTKTLKGVCQNAAAAAALKNTSVVNAEAVSVGKTIKMTGKASGGTAPYTYAFYYKRSESSSWRTIGTEFGTATTGSIKPTAAVSYDLKVIVKDSTGKTATKTFTVMAF